MIVTAAEMRALEEGAFARGVSAEALMEHAGERCAEAVREFFGRPGACVAVFGKGNNGGDALVAARHLATTGWETHIVPAFAESEWNELVHKKFGEYGLARHHAAGGLEEAARGHHSRTLVVLDGLLGVGARGGLRGPIADAARAINRLRERAYAQVFALDLPTGLDADTGAADADCIRADFTLTIGAAKRGLVADGAAAHVGRLVVVPLNELAAAASEEEAATPAVLAPLLKRRSFEIHKGECGRVAIVAGSRGLTGAAVLCAHACIRAGAGLVTLYVPEDAYEIVAAAAAPEVMVRGVRSFLEVLEGRHNVLALGPGLGTGRRAEVLELIRRAETPAIVDADGLNILAEEMSVLAESAAPRLLTPHPGEMLRLAPDSKGATRAETARNFTAKYPVTLLLKGARTVIAEAGQPLSYNTTGNPGMASGGMGDVLTGVCAALAGQGMPLFDAARIGAWVCGRAAELAVHGGHESEESLTARGVIGELGRAFARLRKSWV